METCTLLDDSQPWCATDVDEQSFYQSQKYGYCPEECNGETPRFDSQYNLAAQSQFWSTEIFDLNTYDSGLCHTYNPPRETPPGGAGSFYAWLGHKNKVLKKGLILGFDIFLHEKGQLWPGQDMKRIGISNKIFLKKNTEWSGSFEMHEAIHLDKESFKCVEDPEFSFQTCILLWVSKTAGCFLNWFTPSPYDKIRICDTNEDILRFSTFLTLFLTLFYSGLI